MKVIASTLLAAMAAATTSATTIFVKNLCDHQIDLWDNQKLVPIAPGGTVDDSRPDGWMGMLRHGTDAQATLAEFTLVGGKAWFDISIIPTAPGRGPEYCPSLDACKAFTGGVGYNVQMEIAPRSGINGAHCRTLTCMYDGCPDAYQFPKDDTKTHNCPGGTDFDLIFCPGGTGGQTPPPTTPSPTPAPTPEPTTPAPTNATEERAMDDLFDSGLTDSSNSAAEESATLEIPEPTTEAPTDAPIEIINTEAPVVEANTQAEASGSSATGIVFLVIGAMAAVAGVAMIVVIRRKKAALDAMEDKNSIALRTSTAAL